MDSRHSGSLNRFFLLHPEAVSGAFPFFFSAPRARPSVRAGRRHGLALLSGARPSFPPPPPLSRSIEGIRILFLSSHLFHRKRIAFFFPFFSSFKKKRDRVPFPRPVAAMRNNIDLAPPPLGPAPWSMHSLFFLSPPFLSEGWSRDLFAPSLLDRAGADHPTWIMAGNGSRSQEAFFPPLSSFPSARTE